jgi:hypothetical protein
VEEGRKEGRKEVKEMKENERRKNEIKGVRRKDRYRKE